VENPLRVGESDVIAMDHSGQWTFQPRSERMADSCTSIGANIEGLTKLQTTAFSDYCHKTEGPCFSLCPTRN
jgi:hypothetical protein